jgi:two-component system, LytTR family, response regulator
MKKCIIIDDEKHCRVALMEILKMGNYNLEVIHETDNAEEAYQLIMAGTLKPDLVFLDVQMPHYSGFDFLRKFSHIPFHIIFITAYEQYAIKAIKFSALDYLLKPIDADDLSMAIHKFNRLTQEANNTLINNFKQKLIGKTLFHKLAIASKDEIVFVDTSHLEYFKSDNNYTAVYLSNASPLISSRNIGYYDEILTEHHFFRVHNSYLINLKKIKKYHRGKAGLIEMENGEKITISSRKKEEFVELFSLH